MVQYEDIRDVQVEAGIIATLIYEPCFIHFSDNVDGSYFTDGVNGVFYDAIKSIVSGGVEKIDSFNIMTAINADDKLKRRAGDNFTVDFVDDVIKNSKFIARDTSAEYTKLCAQLSGYAYKRKLYRELESAQRECLNPANDISTLQRSVFDKIERTTSKYVTGESIPTLGSQVDDLWEQTKKRQGEVGYSGLPTKFPSLNKYLTYERGELVVFAGAYKSGKSMLLMNTAADIVMAGTPLLYLDSEMSDRLFLERLICLFSQVRMSDIKGGTYTEEEGERIERAKEMIKELPIYHKYIPIYTTDQIYGTIKKMKTQGLIDCVIFDYIKNKDGKDTSGAYFELGELTNFLKNDIAGALDIPVIAGAQLNRQGEVGDSIKIQQYSSAVVKIKRKTQEEIDFLGEECGNYKFTVTSNRLGDQMIEGEDWIDASFFGHFCLFEEAPKQHIGISPV